MLFYDPKIHALVCKKIEPETALFTATRALMALTAQLKDKTSLLMPDDTFVYRYPPFPVTQGGMRFIWDPKRIPLSSLTSSGKFNIRRTIWAK